MIRNSYWVMAFAITTSLLFSGCGTNPEDPGPGSSISFQESKIIVAGDIQDMDEFGNSVAIDGDSLVVGARSEDGAGLDRGAVYLYDRNQGGADAWGEVKKIIASDAQDGDMFGQAVDIGGDILAVGAAGPIGSTTGRGAVYIYYRNLGGVDNWGEVTRIVGNDSVQEDSFGLSVALAGDCLIVGAPAKGGAGYLRGAAYVFYRDQGGNDAWGQAAQIEAADTHDLECFGFRVAVSSDRAVVGAIGMDSSDTGSAYVFDRNRFGTDVWGQVVKITASDAQPEDQFGISAVIVGDTIIIGAACEDGQSGGIGDNPGSVYIYSRNQGGADAWGEVRKLSNSEEDGAFFGISVDLSGEFLVVGALYIGGSGLNRYFGAIYFFSKNEEGANNWGLLNRATASDGEDFDFLGMSASFSGNYAVVGAPNKNGGGTKRGAAYIFKKVEQ